jgi:hypothetical protein
MNIIGLRQPTSNIPKMVLKLYVPTTHVPDMKHT